MGGLSSRVANVVEKHLVGLIVDRDDCATTSLDEASCLVDKTLRRSTIVCMVTGC